MGVMGTNSAIPMKATEPLSTVFASPSPRMTRAEIRAAARESDRGVCDPPADAATEPREVRP